MQQNTSQHKINHTPTQVGVCSLRDSKRSRYSIFKRAKNSIHSQGFTLIEMLLVIAIIAILAGIVIIAINPSRQINSATDSQRRSDVVTILNAVHQYTIENDGVLPDDADGELIEDAAAKILGTTDTDCSALSCPAVTTNTDCIDLSTDLVTRYITAIPVAPASASITYNDAVTGYVISKEADDRITVQSCENDVNGDPISVSR